MTMNDTETIGRPLDCKTLISILNRGAESALLLGAWCAMEAIAEEDPEGCVRLNPDVPMDASALGDFLHCPVETVENTIGLFRQLRKLTLEDGIILPGTEKGAGPAAAGPVPGKAEGTGGLRRAKGSGP